MAGSGMAAPHLGGGPLGHFCSHMSTLYPFLLLMQTIEVMSVWLMILPMVVLERLTVKITLTSSAERPNFNDRPLQLAVPASHSRRGRGIRARGDLQISPSPSIPSVFIMTQS